MLVKPSKKVQGELPLTPNNLYFHFQEYLITWINIITKERCLYPMESFDYHNSFNLRVPFNRHPKVQEWMNELVSDLMDDLVFKHIRCIVCFVYDGSNGDVLERYTLDLKRFLHVSKDYYDKTIKDLQMDWASVTDEFRGNLYTLLQEIRKLPPLDADKSWKFQVSLETSDISLNTNWVLDKSTDKSKDDNAYMGMDSAILTSTQDDNRKEEHYKTIPLQVVDVGPIVFFSSIEACR